jgi:3-hydroxybutyryl-CoA dehydrogenase
MEIFIMLDKFCRPGTILASNASSLSITEIASVTYRAQKCVGMRFFNPVDEIKRIEVVRALETDDDTLAAVVEVAKRMVKEVVVIKEAATAEVAKKLEVIRAAAEHAYPVPPDN